MNRPCGVLDVDAVRQVVNQRAKQIALLFQRVLRPYPLADVTAHLDDVDHVAHVIENRRCVDLQEDLLAVGLAVGVHHGRGGLGGDDLTQRARLVRPFAGTVAMVGELMTAQADRGVESAGHLAGGTIGQQHAIVAADDQHRVGDRVDHRLQEGARLPDRLLHLLAMRNIRDRGLAERVILQALDRNAAKLHGDGLTAGGYQAQLGSDFVAFSHAFSDMIQEDLLVVLRDILAEGIARQCGAIGPQHLGPGKVDLLEIAVSIQRGIAQRGKVVQIDITILVGFEMLLDLAQFLVLLLQLAFAEFDLVDQAMDLFRRRSLAVSNVFAKQLVDPASRAGNGASMTFSPKAL